AVWAMHAAGDGSRALVAAFWTVLATGAAWDAVPDVRPLHVMVAGLASAAGIVLALHGRLVAMVLALAVHVAVFSVLLRRARSRALLVPLAAALALAVAMSFILLARRPAFAYVPFFTPASAAALATAAACWWLWRQSRDMPRNGAGGPGVDLRWPTGALAALVTFFWCHAELSHAFTPDVAIFLLVVYFALAGVAAIFVGRRYALTAARAAGLALALYAALKAILRAWNYGAVGLKVGSCVLAGAFLFAVAYWYRGRSDVERA
ncbi:MAG TPA: hypothetical protein VFW98_08915, partial [Gemmatimonadaceae bacterium]|nr:hypothetical protein [Gemmatimonadaceae bacterium]